MLQQLESELETLLGIDKMVVVNNGTIAIQMAIKALKLEGEIITTPFTWVASASAILWEHCTPVFVDIDPETLNIDPNKIEAAINHRTCAIMGVHVFSNPCAIESIADIAEKHDLKVIYDAAHAMCVDYKGKSVFSYGDVSATSFHATKLFNTAEGGACVSPDPELDAKLRRIRFFGHDDKKNIVEDGMNGKMTEIHAALGLANLRYLDKVRIRRREIFDLYYNALKDLGFIKFQKFDPESYNYSYMPIIFDTEDRLLRVLNALSSENIFPRRYFYPSINTEKAVAPYTPAPISESISKRIICLPSFTDLAEEKIIEICNIIKKES